MDSEKKFKLLSYDSKLWAVYQGAYGNIVDLVKELNVFL